MKSTSRWASVAAVCVLLSGQGCTESPTAPQPADPPASFAKVKSFTMTELLPPTAWGAAFSYAAAVNDNGKVVGIYAGPPGWESKGWSWQKGEFTDLGTFWPRDINDKGQMVGYSRSAGHVLWDNGVTTPLPGPAVAINKWGHVVGTLTGDRYHAYLWRDGTTTDLGSLHPGSPNFWLDYSEAVGVNDNDQVVAQTGMGAWYDPYRALLWENGTWTELGTAAPGNDGMSRPTGISDNGQVVGLATSAIYHDLPFLWQDGVMTTIGSNPGFHDAEAIDDKGVVAGGCNELAGSAQRNFPCLYYDGGLTELESVASSYATVRDMSPGGKFIVGTSQAYPAHPVVWAR